MAVPLKTQRKTFRTASKSAKNHDKSILKARGSILKEMNGNVALSIISDFKFKHLSFSHIPYI